MSTFLQGIAKKVYEPRPDDGASIPEEPDAGWISTHSEIARWGLCGGGWVTGRPAAMAKKYERS
jgi:hypothetical protein